MDSAQIRRLYALALANAASDGFLEVDVQARLKRELAVIEAELGRAARAAQKFQFSSHRAANPFAQIRSFRLSQAERDEGYEKGMELKLVAERELKKLSSHRDTASPSGPDEKTRKLAQAYWQSSLAYGETLIASYDDAVLTPSERSKIKRLKAKMRELEARLERLSSHSTGMDSP